MLRRALLNSVLALPRFPGHGRLVKFVRNQCYRPYERTLDGSLRMELDVYEWIQLELAEGAFTEPLTIALIKRLLHEGDVMIDVGAHVGTMGLVARMCVGPSGHVVAIEPQPYNCQHILRNWELNGFENLTLFVAAAGPECGTVSLPQQSATDKARLSLAAPMPDALSLRFHVPMMSLESVLQKIEQPRIRLIKIDVEGFELSVLRGLGTAVERVDNIIFEILDDASESGLANCHQLSEWFDSHNFELLRLDGAPWPANLPVAEANLWARRRNLMHS